VKRNITGKKIDILSPMDIVGDNADLSPWSTCVMLSWLSLLYFHFVSASCPHFNSWS